MTVRLFLADWLALDQVLGDARQLPSEHLTVDAIGRHYGFYDGIR